MKSLHGQSGCSQVPATRRKVRIHRGRTFMQIVSKKQGAGLPDVVNHKLLHGQLSKPVPHKPVHCNGSSWAPSWSASGWACGPSRQGHTDLPHSYRPCSVKYPAKFLGVVFAAWHEGASCQKSHFVLQQVEEHGRVVVAYLARVDICIEYTILAWRNRKPLMPYLTGLLRMYCLLSMWFLVEIMPLSSLSYWLLL